MIVHPARRQLTWRVVESAFAIQDLECAQQEEDKGSVSRYHKISVQQQRAST